MLNVVRDGGEDRAALFEAVDQIAGFRCLDSTDLAVDPVCDLVELADWSPCLGVNVDAFSYLRNVDHITHRDGQAVLEQHLAVGDVDVRKRVSRGSRHVEDPDDLESVVHEVRRGIARSDRQVNGVSDLLVELLVDR